MKLRERSDQLDPRVERELDAIDRTIAGERVEPDLAAWAELTEMLREERPEPAQAWAAEVDERVVSRFRRGDGPAPSPSDFAARLRELLPTRVGAPAAALASLAVVAVVAISTVSGGSNDASQSLSPEAKTTSGDTNLSLDEAAPPAPPAPPVPGASGESALPQQSDNAGSAGVAGTASDSASAPLPPPIDSSRVSPGTVKRQIDRDVQLELSTRPDQVRDVSDQVISITRSLDGVVVNSQVSESGRNSSAALQLTIPSRNLDAAIDDLTGLANVESLSEATQDITHPYVTAQDRLQDATAERRSLLEALAKASSAAEADALRRQIADSRREISRAGAAFERIARQARLSDLSVTVTADPNAPEADSGRSLGDWLDDAIDVLRAIAGVLLISAAIVVPLGILISLAWFVTSRVRRGRRERALDS
ncbi:MAG: DUF4349 domain-containing protein [Solirubrobacterales bacterium]